MLPIGAKVRLLTSIYDDGEDHHPPCCCAKHGEIVIVRRAYEKWLSVSHEDVTDSSFAIYPGEFAVVHE